MPDKPHFLIIGSMKAGTTTLYRDLEGHPDIFLPHEKEPDTLTKFGSDLAAIGSDYRSLFRLARPNQLCGEASTSYTKRPDHEGVAELAREVCGPGLKLIYLTRDPVKRAISHYRHDYGAGKVDEPMEEALRRHERYAAYSAYNWQLEPWRKNFSFSNILQLSFEDYVANRSAVLETVCRYLGVDAGQLPPPQEGRAFNKSEGKRVAKGPVQALLKSRLYQRVLKPIIPWKAREWVLVFLPEARQAPPECDAETLAALRSRIAEFEALRNG